MILSNDHAYTAHRLDGTPCLYTTVGEIVLTPDIAKQLRSALRRLRRWGECTLAKDPTDIDVFTSIDEPGKVAIHGAGIDLIRIRPEDARQLEHDLKPIKTHSPKVATFPRIIDGSTTPYLARS